MESRGSYIKYRFNVGLLDINLKPHFSLLSEVDISARTIPGASLHTSC